MASPLLSEFFHLFLQSVNDIWPSGSVQYVKVQWSTVHVVPTASQMLPPPHNRRGRASPPPPLEKSRGGASPCRPPYRRRRSCYVTLKHIWESGLGTNKRSIVIAQLWLGTGNGLESLFSPFHFYPLYSILPSLLPWRSCGMSEARHMPMFASLPVKLNFAKIHPLSKVTATLFH